VVSSQGVFSIPGICALIFFILARPQEFMEELQRLPLLNLFALAAVAGFVIDLKLRRLEPVPVPTFKWACMFLGWAAICDAVKTPDQFTGRAFELVIIFILFATTAHAVQRLRTLEIVAGTVMLTCVFLAVVCVHQGLQDRTCVAIDEVHPGEGYPDGRPCEMADVCYGQEAEPGAEYRCEKVGLFGTYSIEDRVRYRGDLHDPNELSMAVCAGGLSFLIAMALRRRSTGATLLAIVGSLAIGWCILLTQSRGGMLVYLIIVAAYFIRRTGWTGVAIGALLAGPAAAFALGSRSGAAADMSTQLRYEAWAAGLEMFKSSPLFGVGHRMFGEVHYMTAHNSYVLTLAELGMPGMFLFICLLVLTIKMLWRGVVDLRAVPGSEPAQIWGIALLGSFAAIAFQILTLSFAYHCVLWIMFGLAGAWWSAVRTHKPDFDVRLTARDLLFIGVGCLAFVFLILPVFLRFKGA